MGGKRRKGKEEGMGGDGRGGKEEEKGRKGKGHGERKAERETRKRRGEESGKIVYELEKLRDVAECCKVASA